MRSFLDGRGVALSAGLAYSSLLSFIPLVVAVTVLTSTFFGEAGGRGFYRLLRFFVPGTSREVLRGVEALVDEAQAASWIATALLALTSLRVYFDVEGAANHLWGTLRPRPIRQRLSLAVLVVVFGPVALGVVTSLLLESGLPLTQLHVRGLFASMAALTLIYKVVPSARVRWGAAAAAGFVAGAGLTALRQAFTLGFVTLTGVERLYGTISAIAVFVIVTGFAWTILLFGFSFAHAVQFRDELLAHDAPPPAAKKARGPRGGDAAPPAPHRGVARRGLPGRLDPRRYLWKGGRRPPLPDEAPRHRGSRRRCGRLGAARPPARHDHSLRRRPGSGRSGAAGCPAGLRTRRRHPPRPLHARRRRGEGGPPGNEPRGRLPSTRPAALGGHGRRRPSPRRGGRQPGPKRFRARRDTPRGDRHGERWERRRLTKQPVTARFSAPTVGL
ncbi:MAG: YihY/virulence factor BrkB family protein [Holophagales bacterium]|nr:YihY/virulence factor BrkB family protein [Holophagales bacterium]